MPVSIEDIRNVYVHFRKAQAFSKGRGFRVPSDFETHYKNKMSGMNRLSLEKITGFFITKWHNVDPYNYFLCGFEIYKNFTYTQFFNEKVLMLYIQKDKNKKRELTITKKGLTTSAKFVKKYMTDNGMTFSEYMRFREGNLKIAIDHYLKNKIDASFFVLMMRKGMHLTDDDRSLIPYIQQKYRKINFGLNDIGDFIRKVETRL